VSRTCLHPDADAHIHPDCDGCSALVARAAELGHLTHATRRTAAWSAAARPIDDVLAAQRQLQREVEQWQTVHDPRVRRGYLAGHRAERLVIDEPHPPRSLLDRESSDADLVAQRDEPRPGVWAGEDDADLRALTQEQTDYVIGYELYQRTPPAERPEMRAIVGELLNPEGHWALKIGSRYAHRQRGGIHSEPLVRILAHRAWGDRDRQWFELRGVRKGEAVRVLEVRHTGGRDAYWASELLIAVGHPRERSCGVVLEDGRPGELVTARIDMGWVPQGRTPIGRFTFAARDGELAQIDLNLGGNAIARGIIEVRCRVADRLREEPAIDEATPKQQLCAEFGFDRLSIDHDPLSRCSTLTAERGKHFARRFVSDQVMASAGVAGTELRRCSQELDRELTRLGAPRPEPLAGRP